MSTATGVKVTKAAATERAKRHLRYGYYALPEGAAVNCPGCDEKVVSPPFCGQATPQNLRALLVEHLTEWCER